MSLAGSGFWIVHPLDRMRRPDTAGPSRCRTGIQIRVTRHDECLEHTAIPREVTWSCRFHGGDEPVERRRGAIFGLVQNAVEPRDRLVFAAARGNDRYRRLRSCVEGVDLEDVAVALGHDAGSGTRRGLGELFASDPRPHGVGRRRNCAWSLRAWRGCPSPCVL
ncbi:MAG TPA: hypothetical protein VFA00_03730 [Actinomycetota bacterium]|nr:hypothetical protein [Actinomycetota bacterium]